MREGATNTCGDNVDGRVGVVCTDESVRASNAESAQADDAYACAILSQLTLVSLKACGRSAKLPCGPPNIAEADRMPAINLAMGVACAALSPSAEP